MAREEKYIDESKFNADVQAWNKQNTARLKNELNRLGIRDTGRLLRSIKGKTKKENGLIFRVTKEILRHGVFIEKGVGRGYPIESVKGNARAIQGASGRTARPWFNPVLDKDFPRLADKVGEHMADAALKSIPIR